MKRVAVIAVLCCCSQFASPAAGQGYFKQDALFSQRPDVNQSVNTITEFGPVGMSLDLIKPNFTIRIASIEPGSPAEKTGALKPGMIIHTINGEKLADIDPRIQLGNMITKAEAADGKMKMVVSDKPDGETREVVVRLQVMGAYSDTWPMNCPKSDKIVRQYAEYLTQPDANTGFADIGMLFLLSTGDDKYLPTVRKWARGRSKQVSGGYGWHIGYGGLALAEYYLRTGDEQVLPAIQSLADYAIRIENFGGWANKGALGSPTYGGGGGHLSASGVLVPAYLFLAKECGAEIDDESFHRVLRYWYRFAGRGNVPYGNGRPEAGYTDNGKNGKLAFTMAAAAALTPDGEESVYAGARDVCALFAFPSTSFMLHGHTGGGIGEIWRSASMGLLHDKRPQLYRSFMDGRRWHYEMSRKFDGSFRILGGLRYDNVSWGAGYALTYTVPRKTLRLTGAPPTRYSKPYQLPQRPWGTAEDDDFVQLQAIAYPDGTRPDFTKDTLQTGAGIALLKKRSGKLTDEELHRYIRHPQLTSRTYFGAQVVARGEAFVLELLRDDDARLRRLALDAIHDTKGQMLTDKVFRRIIAMLSDPGESWYVKDEALLIIGGASADRIAPHIDVLIPYLHHEEWWLQNAALTALTPVVNDERCYQKVLPAMGKMLENNHLFNATSPLRWGGLANELRQAPPKVAALAREVLKETYTAYVEFDHVLPSVEARVNPTMRSEIATALSKLPGGFDVLYQVTTQQGDGRALPYEDLYLEADAEKFSPELKKAVAKIVETRLIPRYIGQNIQYLVRERDNVAIKHDFYYRGARVEGLVELYRRIGVHDFDWHDFGPKPTEMAWRYHSFDPPEKMPWDTANSRYRKVTLPDGMSDWYKPSFDPAKHGWKTGLQPFGASNGELDTNLGGCGYDFCRHGEPMKTLWEKETLLMRGKFKFPEFKDGYRYRLVIGGMSHVGAGEGYQIHINGKPFAERPRGVGRREGAKLIGKHIDKTWWSDFSGKEVDIAHISFMNIHKGRKHRHLMIWVQEMKLPPMGDKEFIHSATVVPMTSAEWQKLQDPDDADHNPNEGKFRWDGKFERNDAVLNKWKTVGYVNKIEDFDPNRPRDANRARFKEITFNGDGTTDDPTLIWSGDTLMDLRGNQALRVVAKQINGAKYLFIEQGGFQTKHGMAWESPWVVLIQGDR